MRMSGRDEGASPLEPLFTPFTLGPLRLRNRFIMSPMQRFRPADLIPDERHIEYYRQRAGAVGMIVTQGTTFDDPTSESAYARFFPASYPAWSRCVEVVRSRGSQLVLQLWHEGGQRAGGWSPSGLSSSGHPHGNTLDMGQIERLVESYARSAGTARDLGFSGVELHAGHGYLLGQFIGPLSNVRTDRYGGDLPARLRFPLEVVRAVRSEVGPTFPVGLRTSLWPGTDGTRPTLRGPAELEFMLSEFVAAGIDYFNALKLRFWTPEFAGSDLSYAGWISRLTRRPVVAGGSVGLADDLEATLQGRPAHADAPCRFEDLVRRFRRGDFALVSVGRTIMTDPEWLDKVRAQRYHELKPVLRSDEILTGPTNPERIVYD